MKKFFQYAFAAVIAVSAFTSCSDDDDPVVPGANIENKSYTATDGLNLVVNGEPLVGKTITFTKGADDNATIKLAGEGFDLSSIMGQIGTKATPQPGLMVPTCGVIPGSPEYEFQVKLIGTGDECVFEGGEETEYCTFKYSGKVTKDALDFNITDLKLKNTSLVGVKWKLPEYDPFSPIGQVAIKWISPTLINMDIWGTGNPFPMEINAIANMTMAIPMIPDPFAAEGTEADSFTIGQTLIKLLKNVEFCEDGNIIAKYVDIEKPDYPELDSPVGIAQYVITEEGKMLVYLNPQKIIQTTIANATKAIGTRALEDPMIIENLLSKLLPMLQNGVPLYYHKFSTYDDWTEETTYYDNIYSFVLGKDTLLPLFEALTPILSDEEFVDQLVEMASQDKNLGMMANNLKPILQTLPEIIKTTTDLEIGINLEK